MWGRARSYAELSLTKSHVRHASHTTTDTIPSNTIMKIQKHKLGRTTEKKMIGKVWFGQTESSWRMVFIVVECEWHLTLAWLRSLDCELGPGPNSSSLEKIKKLRWTNDIRRQNAPWPCTYKTVIIFVGLDCSFSAVNNRLSPDSGHWKQTLKKSK